MALCDFVRFPHHCVSVGRGGSASRVLLLYIIYLKACDGISLASSEKPSKRKKLSNSFDKNRADVLAASDPDFHVEQEKLIALDEEEQSRWENETVSSSRLRIEDNGKDEPAEPDSQESFQQLAGQTIFAEFERKFPY